MAPAFGTRAPDTRHSNSPVALAGLALLTTVGLTAVAQQLNKEDLSSATSGSRTAPSRPADSAPQGQLLLVDRSGHSDLARSLMSLARSETIDSLRENREFGARLFDLLSAVGSDRGRIHSSSDPRAARFDNASSAIVELQDALYGPRFNERDACTALNEFTDKVAAYVNSLAQPPGSATVTFSK